MRLAVLGSNGMLGRYAHDYISTKSENVCNGYTRSDFDVLSITHDEIVKIVSEYDYIINCIGVLKPLIEHVGIENTKYINTTFPQLLADACDKYETRLIHICTDCVFSGLRGKYIETDVCDADDIYGMSKSKIPENAMVLRTSIIGEENKDNHNGLLQWVLSNKNKQIDGYINCIWNGVTCLQLVKTIDYIITTGKYKPGLFHIYTEDSITKYDLCVMISEIYNLPISIIPKRADSISGTIIVNTLDRTLKSIYDQPIIPPTLRQQIEEQMKYEFK